MGSSDDFNDANIQLALAVIRKLWEKKETTARVIFLNLSISWTMPSKIDDTLFSWDEAGFGARDRSRWRMIPACIWWTSWRERNDRCFENRSNNLQEFKLKCVC
ncbi:hypothetical protein P3L10_008255 [Capsicum annuum]